ncbi:uncharacterized protein LOC118438759 [Folsomia candida]|uniref:uncharacterized protein LOC118438759 n=1 Tax=Folsomia candida TaxID=158441 RepID=UPI001605299A|nr:uncharacterized protein LOC118438759 [Folsomia candida]
MAKIVRVSHPTRGKKLVLGDSDYELFSISVKQKFLLDPDAKISFEDEYGAEVDEDIFQFYCIDVSSPMATAGINSSPASSETSLLFIHLFLFNSDLFNLLEYHISNFFELQIIEAHIQQNNKLEELVRESIINSCVTAQASSTLIKELVAKFIELKGISPTSKDQRIFAKAILLVIPSWRYPGSDDGTDILFDQVGRGGLIQARLRHIHKSINKDKPKAQRKRALPRTEDSSLKRVAVGTEVADSSTLDSIRKLSGLCPKTAENQIKRLMQETLQHRSMLRQTRQLGILNTYNKFLECDFLINYEFSLMHENSVKNFVDIWPAGAPKIVQKGPEVCRTPALQKFLMEEANNWDINISALFTLLHLIPPAPQGQGRGSRSNIGDAKELLVSFFKSGTPLQSILNTWADKKSQPNLACLGDNKKDLTSYFIVCDRKILSIAALNSAEAIDTLFKSHYVFATEYDKNLSGLWNFIQVYLYKLELGTTTLPRKVKQVYSQLASIFDVHQDC